MKILVDTQILLWASSDETRLPAKAARLISAGGNQIFFSAASIWELTIKQGLGRLDFQVDVGRLWRGLMANGYEELAVTAAHAMEVALLPAIHKDPFDRILLAQAKYEGIGLLTADRVLAQYPVSTVIPC